MMGRSEMKPTKRASVLGFAMAASLAVTGCISLGGGEPPESLLTLTSTATAASEAQTSSAAGAEALVVMTPDTAARLDVTRVPVAVSDTELAYLQEAVWVEKPARLFKRLVGETIRAGGAPFLVLDGEDTPVSPTQYLRGTLLDMTYYPGTSEVVVRYDAIHTDGTGAVRSRRFEAREGGVLPEPASVGPALNRAANEVAGEVAAWIAQG